MKEDSKDPRDLHIHDTSLEEYRYVIRIRVHVGSLRSPLDYRRGER